MEDRFIELCQQIRQSADYMRKSKCLSVFDTEQIVKSARELKEKVMISLTAGQNVDILLKEGNENSGRYPRGSGDDQEVEGPNGSKITKKHNPNDYSNVKCGSSGNTERTETDGFVDKVRRQEHWEDHGRKMGFKTPKEYEEAAAEFLSKPLNKNMEELSNSDGSRVRYDYSSNEFGASTKNNSTLTFYKPDTGADYWETRIKEKGKKV